MELCPPGCYALGFSMSPCFTVHAPEESCLEPKAMVSCKVGSEWADREHLNSDSWLVRQQALPSYGSLLPS